MLFENTQSMFQSTYKQADIEYIENKLDRIYSMQMNEDEKDNFDYLQKTWLNLKK